MNELRKYKTIDFWIKKASGSEVTERVYLNKFGRFLKHHNIDPDEIIRRWKQVRYDWKERQKFIDEWSEKIENYYLSLDGSPLGKRASITPILSFFKHHKIDLNVELNKHMYVKYRSRDITKEEIKRILMNVGIRERAFFLMMTESGLRPRTIVKLRYISIKKDFEKGIVPMKIDVPAEIAKDRIGNRFSFVGIDGYNTLREYLLPKIPLDDNDLLFVAEKNPKNPYLSPETFSKIFSNVILKLKLEKKNEANKPKLLRMYCLRKYFRNNIGVELGFREFWMGHKWGTDEHYLTRNVEKHREAYKKAYANLRIHSEPSLEIRDLQQNLEEARKEIQRLRENNIKLKKLAELAESEAVVKFLERVKNEKIYLVTEEGEKELK